MDIEKDDVMQRKMAIKSLLENSGYALYQKNLDDFRDYAEAQVSNLLDEGSVDLDKLSKLNFELGRKAGLRMALNIIEGFKEELVD